MEEKKATCPFCGNEMTFQLSGDHCYRICHCPTCGWYVRKVYPEQEKAMENCLDETASFLYYTGNKGFCNEVTPYTAFLGDRKYYDKYYADCPAVRYISEEEVRAFYPRTFSDRISKILLGFANRSEFLGDTIALSERELESALFIRRYDKDGYFLASYQLQQQYGQIRDYLIDNGYAAVIDQSKVTTILLHPNGWKRIEELQLNSDRNRNVFVSMAFNNDTKKTREAIRAGIVKAEYSPEFIDEIIHNKQIVPEMFRLIRESRFLILDISDPNYGAYYEAGYALGLGKEVIITCSQKVFTNEYQSEDEKKYEKYLRPHFDIAQKQILVWKNYEDLTKKLAEWIRAVIG